MLKRYTLIISLVLIANQSLSRNIQNFRPEPKKLLKRTVKYIKNISRKDKLFMEFGAK